MRLAYIEAVGCTTSGVRCCVTDSHCPALVRNHGGGRTGIGQSMTDLLHPSEAGSASPVSDDPEMNSFPLLSRLLPAGIVVHIGAGASVDLAFYAQIGARNVVLIEADEDRCNRLSRQTKGNPRFSVVHAVIGGTETTRQFHQLSIADESGLIDARTLSTIWPNLKLIETREVQCRTLAAVLAEHGRDLGADPTPDWIVIDCLGGGEILEACHELTESAGVVVVRTAEIEGRHDTALGRLSREPVTARLQDRGFVEVDSLPERNAMLTTIVLARDWKAALRRRHASELRQAQSDADDVRKARDEALAQVTGLKSENERLAAELDRAKSNAAVLRQVQSDADSVRKARDKALAQITSLKNENKGLVAELDDAKSDAAMLRQVQSDADDVRKARDEALAQVTGLKSENERLAAELDRAKSNADGLQKLIGRLEALLQTQRQTRMLQMLGLSGAPEDIDGRLLQCADEAYGRDDFEAAVELYALCCQRTPDNAWCFQGLAEALARYEYRADPYFYPRQLARDADKFGRWDVVVRHYRKALSLDADISAAFLGRFPPRVKAAFHENACDPVFVLGCGHSGTSIMIRILAEHPEIMAVEGESAAFLKTDDGVQRLFSEWDLRARAAKASRWIEKTPPHIFQIGRFMAFRPEAKFILMVRDGRDVVCSLRHRAGYENIEDRIDRWVYDNMAGMPYWTHPNVMVVKYEDLVEGPEATIRAIFDFLSLDFAPDAMNYHEREVLWYSDELKMPESNEDIIDHKNIRNWQINQPIFDGRGKWKDEMLLDDQAVLDRAELFNRTMRIIGYTG